MDEKFAMLIIASEPQVREQIKALFMEEYLYIMSTNIKDAIEKATEGNISVMILHEDIDDMDAFEAILEAKHTPPVSLIPIVFISKEDPSAQQRALSAGADAFLTFDYDLSISRLHVRNVVDKYISHVLLPRRQLEYEHMINQCLKTIYSNELTDDTFANILKISADYMNSERAYFFHRWGNSMLCFAEFCAPGAKPQREELKNIDMRPTICCQAKKRRKRVFKKGEHKPKPTKLWT